MELLNFQLKDYDPSKPNDAQLADDWRLVCAKYSTMTAGGNTEFESLGDCQEFATAVLKEILKRGKITFHPDKMKATSLELLRSCLEVLIKGGLYLVEPHGRLIYEGKKSAMVKSRRFKRCQVFNILCSGPRVYGFIRFKPEDAINLPAFTSLHEQHQVSEEERKNWWPSKTELYLYPLRDFIPLEKPQTISVPQGVQVFIDKVNLKHQVDLPQCEDRVPWIEAQLATAPDFVWIPDYISLTGSTLFADRPPHDIDVVVRDIDLDVALRIKLERIFLDLFEKYPHFVPSLTGPNWPYIPMYDLVLVKKPDFKLIPINEPEFKTRLYHQRVATPEVARQAERSCKEDKLTLFQFYRAMKPTRITLAGERQTVDRFVSYFLEGDFPVFNSQKFDGMHLLIFKGGDKVTFWSDDGSSIANERMPSIVEELKVLKADNFIVEAELELWIGEIHQPREAVAAKLHRSEVEPDDDLIAHVFTCLFLNDEDLHKEDESHRQEALDSLGIKYSTNDIPDLKHKLNKVPNDICHNLRELKNSTEKLRFLPASEGVVAKKANSVFFLDGNAREGWIKFHNNAVLKGKVAEAIETKTAGAWNYVYAIRPSDYPFKKGDLLEVGDEELVEVGKTFSTSVKCQRGDLIEVEFETFNFTEDQRTDTVTVSAWAPVFLRKLPSRGVPDEVDDILEKAEKEHILQRKIVTEEGETFYHD